MDPDAWEQEFVKLFREKAQEDPLYEYIQYYKQGLSPAEAVKTYLKENPDYLEKVEELEETKNRTAAEGGDAEAAEMLRKAMEMNRRREAEQRLSAFCPNCARVMGDKKRCKCGYVKGRG
jgi:hypothetical protein